MNEELLRLRGKYEFLREELQDISAQIATEGKEIATWAHKFDYCDRSMSESILSSTREIVSQSDIMINRIRRLKELHDQAISKIDELKNIKPLINRSTSC